MIGGPDTLRSGLERFLEATGANELMVATDVYDQQDRKRSFEILAEVWRG